MKNTGNPPYAGPVAALALATLVLAGAVFASGCAIFGGEKLLNPKSDSPVHLQVVTQSTPATVAQTTSPAPSIKITSLPAFGKKDPVRGSAGGVTPADYKVVVYIYVDGWYGPKPLWDRPLTTIESDSTWSCSIMTTKTDETATQVAAYIVPNGVIPEKSDGAKELPVGMAQYPYTIAMRT